jgi:hypothetical protein
LTGRAARTKSTTAKPKREKSPPSITSVLALYPAARASEVSRTDSLQRGQARTGMAVRTQKKV